MRAEVELALARAVVATDGDRAEAIERAQTARELYARWATTGSRTTAIDRGLKHPRPPTGAYTRLP